MNNQFEKNICTNCNSILVKGGTFCDQCGTKISYNEINKNDKAIEKQAINVYETNIKINENNSEVYEEVEQIINTDKDLLMEENVMASEEKVILNEEKVIVDKRNKNLKTSKNNTIAIVSILMIAFLLITIFATKNILNKQNSSNAVISNFRAAIMSDDIEKLGKVLVSNDPLFEIDDEALTTIKDYFKNDIAYLSDTCKDLSTQALTLEVKEADNSNKSIYLKRIPGIITKYKLVVTPIYVNVISELDNCEILVNDKSYGELEVKNEKKVIGPLAPGNYDFTVNYNGEYVVLNETNKIDGFLDDKDDLKLYYFENLNSIKLSTKYTDAKVIINGKDTMKTVEDLNGIISPSNSDMLVKLEVTIDGKTFTTAEENVGTSTIIYFDEIKEANDLLYEKAFITNFMLNKDREVKLLMEQYNYAFSYDVNSGNFENLEDYLYLDSNLYKAQKEYVKDAYNKTLKEDFISLKIEDVKFDEQTKEGTVVVTETYKTYQNGKSEKKDYKYTYIYKYISEKKKMMLIDMKAL